MGCDACDRMLSKHLIEIFQKRLQMKGMITSCKVIVCETFLEQTFEETLSKNVV